MRQPHSIYMNATQNIAAAATQMLTTVIAIAELDLCKGELELARVAYRLGCEERVSEDPRLLLPTFEDLFMVATDLMGHVELWAMGEPSICFTEAVA